MSYPSPYQKEKQRQFPISPLVYACELWVFAMCPALRGSTVSYAGVAHFPKHSLEYSLNFWSQSKKKKTAAVSN